MRTLVCKGFGVFIVTSVPWHKGPFLVGKVFINTCILQEAKMFTYILMRGGQARPCQTRQRFAYPFQLPSVSSLPRLCIFWSSHLGVVDLKEQPSALRWNYWLYDIVVYVYECISKVDRFIKTVSFASSLSSF